MCNTPLRISQRCAKYHRDHLHSVQHTTAYHTAYRGDHLSGVQHTAESRVPNLKKSPGRVTYRGDDLCAHHRDDISGVPHTAEINSALCNTPQRQSPWCATYCGVKGSKFKKTSVVCKKPPQKKSRRCATHCGDDLSGVQHTTETISAVCNTSRRQIAHRRVKIEIFTYLWLFLKGQSGEILLGVITSK